MLGVFANNANHAHALDDFALVADPFYGRTNLHFSPPPGTFRQPSQVIEITNKIGTGHINQQAVLRARHAKNKKRGRYI